MKVPREVIETRRKRLQELVAAHRYLPLGEVCRRLGISEATARRDLASLQKEGRLRRTRGGALSDFNDRFPSFSERRARGASGKRAMAEAALRLIRPGGTYFFDSGTTLAYLAEAMAAKKVGALRVLTLNLPVADILATIKDVEVHLTGGRLFRRQSVLLGEAAARSIAGWNFDAAFLSAEGMDAEGLWNSELSIIAHQHAVIRRAKKNVFLLDASKLGRTAAHFLLPWPAVDCLLSDAKKRDVAREAPGAESVLWSPGGAEPRWPEPLEGREGSLPVHYL